ncbi:hypothetical protein HY450_03775 [Candidatus Pacearchaeota archaeon]|nr:hypothetical protein [Candidatus Pacearchaeota archaeon]
MKLTGRYPMSAGTFEEILKALPEAEFKVRLQDRKNSNREKKIRLKREIARYYASREGLRFFDLGYSTEDFEVLVNPYGVEVKYSSEEPPFLRGLKKIRGVEIVVNGRSEFGEIAEQSSALYDD